MRSSNSVLRARPFALLTLLAGLCGLPRAEAAPLTLTPCDLPGLSSPARCGTYEVWEDRDSRTGRRIALKVVLLPATSAERRPDPLVFFAGGPGESVTSSASGLATGLAPLLAHRDAVLIDVRGTGGSAPLLCDGMMSSQGVQKFLDDFLPVAEVEKCRQQYEGRAELGLYTTANAVDDVAEVLTALGVRQANLLGGSYGTRAAQAFAIRHPDLVRTIILDGVLPMDERAPLQIARDAQNAFDGWARECAEDEACHQAFPDVQADFAAVRRRLEREPVQVQVLDPKAGSALTIQLDKNGLAQTVRYMLYMPSTAVTLPLFLHQAAAGDWSGLGEMALFFGSSLTQMADGFYLSVTCAEDVAFLDPTTVPAAIEGTFLGDFRIARQQAACAAWPYRKLGPETLAPLQSPVPTLLISGEHDPVTPASNAVEVAKHLPNAVRVVVPDGCHSAEGLVGADCLSDLVRRFVEAGTTAGLDTSCVAQVHRPPFLLTRETPGQVQLSAAELTQRAGTYLAPGGLEIVLSIADGRLVLTTPGGEKAILLPLSSTRFALAGAPPGYAFELELDAEGRAIGGAIVQTGGERIPLQRKPASP